MSKHTPLPWHLEEDKGHPFSAIGEDIAIVGGEETGEGVRFVIGRFCDFGPHGNEQTEANARLIHRAVNSHEALVGACKAALAELIDMKPPHVKAMSMRGCQNPNVQDQLVAAIAKAEPTDGGTNA